MATRDKLMIATLLYGGILVFLSQTMLAPAFPAIMREFTIDTTAVQWLASAYTLAMAAVVPANAFLLSRFSVRMLFGGSMAVLAAACLVSYAAPMFGVALFGRVVQGLMAGAVMPTVMTAVVTMFPDERRGLATGTIAISISGSAAIGPALSGVLIDAFGWRMLFLALAVLAAIAAILSRFSLFNRIEYKRVPLDIPSATLMVLGISTLLYGTSSLASASNLAVSGACIVVGIVLCAVFVHRQAKLEYPFLKVGVMRTRSFCAACLVMALANAALICTEAVFPLFIQNVLGQSAFVSGIAIFPAVLVGLPFALVAGSLFDKHGVRAVTWTGAVLMVVGAVALLFYTPATSVVLLAALFVIMQIGGQLLFAPSQAWGLNSLEPQEIPHGSSLFSTFEQLGASFGIAIILGLVSLPESIGMATDNSAFYGVHLGFIGCFAITLIILAIVVAFARDTRKK